MRILVVGSGGREHALAWSFARSGHDVVTAPGNPGTAQVGENVDVPVSDLDGIVREATERSADLVVVGPEAPLADGLADRCRRARIPVFGPTRDGARIETSKAYAKEIMERGSVPTARAEVAEDLDAALAAAKAAGGPCVVKADGLAAGKGVIVADDQGEAEAAVRDCFAGRFGSAGSKVVVEERLEGPELSLLVLCDGERIGALPAAQDHKPIGAGDTGPNTGGVGAYSPVPVADAALVETIMDTVIEPTLWALGKDGVVYQGVLYCGLMLTDDGPMVLEYNCRFGDPEAQVVIPRLDMDLGSVLGAAAGGALDPTDVEVGNAAALGVVACADGYPESPRKGDVISGVDAAAAAADTIVFHAGTKRDAAELVTAGGRVLAVVGLGDDLESARDRAYAGVDDIDWDGMYVRRDIGYRVFGS